jgi:hypothetical protein
MVHVCVCVCLVHRWYLIAVGGANIGNEAGGRDDGCVLDPVASDALEGPGGQGGVVHGECGVGEGVLYGHLHIAVECGSQLQIPPVCNKTPGYSLTPS